MLTQEDQDNIAMLMDSSLEKIWDRKFKLSVQKIVDDSVPKIVNDSVQKIVDSSLKTFQKSVDASIEKLAISVKESLDDIEERMATKKETATKEDIKDVATKKDVDDLKEELSIKYGNRLDKHSDDIRLIKTELKMS